MKMGKKKRDIPIGNIDECYWTQSCNSRHLFLFGVLDKLHILGLVWHHGEKFE